MFEDLKIYICVYDQNRLVWSEIFILVFANFMQQNYLYFHTVKCDITISCLKVLLFKEQNHVINRKQTVQYQGLGSRKNNFISWSFAVLWGR